MHFPLVTSRATLQALHPSDNLALSATSLQPAEKIVSHVTFASLRGGVGGVATGLLNGLGRTTLRFRGTECVQNHTKKAFQARNSHLKLVCKIHSFFI